MMIGRKHEQEILNQFYNSDESEFLAIYGRRRVGKTFLVTEFFKGKNFFFELIGMRDTPAVDQLHHFLKQFKKTFPDILVATKPQSWREALEWLSDAIEKKCAHQKVVLFFDELPWLSSRKSGFLNALDHFWNSWASRQKNVKLIVCGSAASWMLENIIQAKGGLHNRLTRRIRLLPFDLAETNNFLKSRHIVIDQKQILELFMIMGGVPHYLKQIEKGKSVLQNIDQICFSKDGFLATEFDQLFASLFENSQAHTAVMRALAMARYGLTRNELIKKTKRTSGGGLHKILRNLEEAGFIASYESYGKTNHGKIYRVNDEYSCFFLRWITMTPKSVLANSKTGYWQQMSQTPAWQTWAGFAFERICFKHMRQVKKALGIEGVVTRESTWKYVPQNAKEKGAQIDLLIDRKDQCVSVCEIKFSNSTFVIDKAFVNDFENKLTVFRQIAGIKKSLLPVMITTFGVKKNDYATQLIQNEVVLGDLFDRKS